MSFSTATKHLNHDSICSRQTSEPWQLSVTIKCLNLVIFYRHHAPVDRWAGKSSARQANIAGDTCSQYQNWRIEPTLLQQTLADPSTHRPPHSCLALWMLQAPASGDPGLDSTRRLELSTEALVCSLFQRQSFSHIFPFFYFLSYFLYFLNEGVFFEGLALPTEIWLKLEQKRDSRVRFDRDWKGNVENVAGLFFFRYAKEMWKGAQFFCFLFQRRTRGRRRQRVSSMCAWHAYWAFVACSFLPGVVAVVVVVVVLIVVVIAFLVSVIDL